MVAQVDELSETSTESISQFCHILCSCTPKIAICGAYKPMYCRVPITEISENDRCRVCRKEFCEMCTEVMHEPCPYCGG